MRFPRVSAVVFALALAPAASNAEGPAILSPLASTPFSAVFSLPMAAAGGAATSFHVSGETRPGYLKGRFLVGVTTGRAMTPEGDLASEWKIAPFIRNTPRRAGWGPSFGLNWFTGDISVPVNGQRTKVGELKVRPVMAGVSYGFINGRAVTSLSLVGGYAFNSARITQALPEGTSASIRVENAWVVRPNIGLTYALTHRLALVGSLGYVFTKPTITIDVDQAGQPRQSFTDTHRSDYVNATFGLAFSIF